MIINDEAHTLALHARANTTVAATTGVMDLAVTETAFTRADAGSFVADGFCEGMEVRPVGFPSATPRVLTEVTALSMKVDGPMTVAPSAASRSLIVGMPSIRVLENFKVFENGQQLDKTKVGRWYSEEDYIPGPRRHVWPGPNNLIESNPMYVIRLFGIANTGTIALRRVASALLDTFAPFTDVIATSTQLLRVLSNPAPYPGQVLPGPPGWSYIAVTIPCFARAANII